MNTRCYRCGWSFSLSREAIQEAAVSSAGQKAHVIQCPRCRQAIRIPMDQIMHDLPPGWTPPAPAGDQTAAAPEAASAPANAASQAPEPVLAEASEQPQRRSERRHRRSGKTHSGDSAAVPVAKKSTHPT